MTSILDETQEERDLELSAITGSSIYDLQKIKMCSPDTIRIYSGTATPKDLVSLYKDFPYLDIVGYLRTLMMTSIERRHHNLISLLRATHDKECLDFGSGVGTHTIALMERNNRTSMLDVDGPLREFAIHRIRRRFGVNSPYQGIHYVHTMDLPDSYYDVVVCADVLEHVPDPLRELVRIWRSMKKGGTIHLEVSTMVKPSSGHFVQSIDRWRAEGVAFLGQNFTRVKQTIYTKK